jgi:serine/threonine-protein kinase HipA
MDPMRTQRPHPLVTAPQLGVLLRSARNSTARKVGYGDNAEALLSEIVERTPAVVEQVRDELPAGFSEAAANKVLGGLLAAAQALEAGDG